MGFGPCMFGGGLVDVVVAIGWGGSFIGVSFMRMGQTTFDYIDTQEIRCYECDRNYIPDDAFEKQSFALRQDGIGVQSRGARHFAVAVSNASK